MSAVLRAKPSTGPCWPRSSVRGWRSSNLRLGIRLRRLPRLIPSLAGCRTSFRRPFLGFYRRDGLGIGATAADQRLLSRTRGHPAGGHFCWLVSSRSTPTCRRAESAGRDGRTAGLFELAGGLDRYLGCLLYTSPS